MRHDFLGITELPSNYNVQKMYTADAYYQLHTIALKISQIFWCDVLQEMSRKFRVKFPEQNVFQFDLAGTFP